MTRLALILFLGLTVTLIAPASAQIGPPGRPQLATQGEPPPAPNQTPVPPQAPPQQNGLATPCVETPNASTVAWVDDDNRAGGRDGSRANPFSCSDLIGASPAVDLFARGFRDICVEKAASNYSCFHAFDRDRELHQQGDASTGTMLNFWAHPAVPNAIGNDAAFAEVPQIDGIVGAFEWRCDQREGHLAWRGFRFGNGQGNHSTGFYGASDPGRPNGPGSTNCRVPRIHVEYNYFAAKTMECGGNDFSISLNGTSDSFARYNYFATPQPDTCPQYAGYAGVRDYRAVRLTIANNDFYFCKNSDKTFGADAIYVKADEVEPVVANNRTWTRNDCPFDGYETGGMIYQGSGYKDASTLTYERNYTVCKKGRFCERTPFEHGASGDSTRVRNNLFSGYRYAIVSLGQPCDGSEHDDDSSTDFQMTGNLLIDINNGAMWQHYRSNIPSFSSKNAFFNSPQFRREHFTVEYWGHNSQCGPGGPENKVRDFASYEALPWTSDNASGDPMMVCQYEGDRSCKTGTPWNPEDIRFCTGAGTPHASCPGKSPFVDAQGIADRGPYEGENMNNPVSSYSVQLGPGWVPPPGFRR